MSAGLDHGWKGQRVQGRAGVPPGLEATRTQAEACGYGRRRLLAAVVATAGVLAPAHAWACAACFGQSDSAMARSMNWGIFSLLAVVIGVLGGVASFFIYLARRSALAPEPTGPAPAPESVEQSIEEAVEEVCDG